MMHFDETGLYELGLPGGIYLPRILMTTYGLPDIEITVGEKYYTYERSFPIKGHASSMTPHIRAHLEAGRVPLVIERPDRFYVYIERPAPAAPAAPAPEAPAAAETPAQVQAASLAETAPAEDALAPQEPGPTDAVETDAAPPITTPAAEAAPAEPAEAPAAESGEASETE